jgi:hypothetical protein
MLHFPEDPTHTYKLFSKNKGHCKYVQCQAKRVTDRGNEFCVFQERSDHFKKSIHDGNIHTCNFALPDEETPNHIPFYYQIHGVSEGDFGDLTEESLITEMLEFVAKFNLPIAAASSTSMYNLLLHAIRYGAANPTSDPHELLRQLSRGNIRTKFISLADDRHRRVMQEYAKMPYVAVAIDEGTIKSKKTLDFLLENSCAPGVPSYPAGLTEIERYKLSLSAVISTAG